MFHGCLSRASVREFFAPSLLEAGNLRKGNDTKETFYFNNFRHHLQGKTMDWAKAPWDIHFENGEEKSGRKEGTALLVRCRAYLVWLISR